MKKINYVLILVTFTVFFFQFSYAQIPQKFNYQAVVRNNAGQLLTNKLIAIRVMIHDQSATGPIVYCEIYTKTTNSYGLLNLEIGSGPAYVGTFTNINWATGSKYLEIQMDITGGINYLPIGTTQLLSVPYALYSDKVLNTTGFDMDSVNELQTLSIIGKSISISKGNTITLNDNDSVNELQKLAFSGDTISITRGNKFYLPYLRSQWWQNNGTSVYYNTGNVGIGTSSPLMNLDVISNINSWIGIGTTSNVGFAGISIDKGSNTAMTNGEITYSTGGVPKWHLGMIKRR